MQLKYFHIEENVMSPVALLILLLKDKLELEKINFS